MGRLSINKKKKNSITKKNLTGFMHKNTFASENCHKKIKRQVIIRKNIHRKKVYQRYPIHIHANRDSLKKEMIRIDTNVQPYQKSKICNFFSPMNKAIIKDNSQCRRSLGVGGHAHSQMIKECFLDSLSGELLQVFVVITTKLKLV